MPDAENTGSGAEEAHMTEIDVAQPDDPRPDDPRLVDGVPTCPACGGTARSRRYRVDDYDLYRCVECRTEFLVLRPDGRPHDGHYWDDYKFEAYGNEESRAEYSQRYADVLAESSKYTSTIHRSLDVGCGIGNFASWAVDRGLDAVGAEVDEEAIGAARARGLVVYELEEMASAIEPGSLDLITMWDVIEHLVDPATAVRDLVPLLRPGGLMVLETPDVAFPLRPMSIAVRKVAEPIRYSDVLYFADHRTYFSVAGLRHLLEAEGLDFMTDMAMRSPNAKMRSQFDHMSEGGRGLTMGRLYGPLDRSMNALGMTNKMIVIARRSWDVR